MVVFLLGLLLSLTGLQAQASEESDLAETLARCQKEFPRYRDESALAWSRRLLAHDRLECVLAAYRSLLLKDTELVEVLKDGLPYGRWRRIELPPEPRLPLRVFMARALRDPEALPFLRKIVEDPEQPRMLVLDAFEAIGALSLKKPDPSFLYPFLENEEGPIRLAAALALAERGQIGDARPHIEPFLFDPEPDSRKRAQAFLEKDYRWRSNSLLDFAKCLQKTSSATLRVHCYYDEVLAIAAQMADQAPQVVRYFLNPHLRLEQRHQAGEFFCGKYLNFTYAQLMSFDEALVAERSAAQARGDTGLVERLENWRSAFPPADLLSPRQAEALNALMQKLDSERFADRKAAQGDLRYLFNLSGWQILPALYQGTKNGTEEAQSVARQYLNEGSTFEFPVGLTNFLCPYSKEAVLHRPPAKLLP